MSLALRGCSWALPTGQVLSTLHDLQITSLLLRQSEQKHLVHLLQVYCNWDYIKLQGRHHLTHKIVIAIIMIIFFGTFLRMMLKLTWQFSQASVDVMPALDSLVGTSCAQTSKPFVNIYQCKKGTCENWPIGSVDSSWGTSTWRVRRTRMVERPFH